MTMTMTEIYENPTKWMRELEEEWLEEYGSDLEDAWAEIDDYEET